MTSNSKINSINNNNKYFNLENNLKVQYLTEPEVANISDFTSFKVIIVGDSSVGKSCILKRAVHDNFESGYQATVGFEFLLMHYRINNINIKLQIWDTCGQEMYRSLVQGFYRNTSLVIIVYDITSKKSFEDLDEWIKDITLHMDKEAKIFIMGNKNDLKEQRVVENDMLKNFCEMNNNVIYFVECSAKSGDNVKRTFEEAAKFLYGKYMQMKEKYGDEGEFPTNMGYKKKKLTLPVEKDDEEENNGSNEEDSKCC